MPLNEVMIYTLLIITAKSFTVVINALMLIPLTMTMARAAGKAKARNGNRPQKATQASFKICPNL